MSRAPLLSKPLPGEVLLLYLWVSSTAISSVLIRKPEKQGSSKRGASVPSLGIASTCPCCLGAKAPPILPSTRDHGIDHSAPSAGTSKARNVRQVGQMGDRVVQAKACEERSSRRRLHLQAHTCAVGSTLSRRCYYGTRKHGESNNGRLRSEGCLYVRLPIGSPPTPTKVLGLQDSTDPKVKEQPHRCALVFGFGNQ
ncbi:unnamed protein product [Prunus armeniaca]